MRKMFESFKQIKIKEYITFLIYFLAIFAGVFAFDQITKYVAEVCLQKGDVVVFIPHFIEFTLVYNKGAAWGMGDGAIWSRVLLAIMSWAVMFFIIGYVIYLFIKHKKINTFFGVTLALILAGDVGNLIDRTFFFDRGVIDFISIQSRFKGFGVFNIADSALVVGVFCLLIYFIIEEVQEQKRQKRENEKKLAEAKALDAKDKAIESTKAEEIKVAKEETNNEK